MQRAMRAAMIWQIVHQAGKITIFRVTGGVRSHLKILRIFSKIHHQGHAWFLSKNVLCRKNSLRTAPFSHVDQSLPTT